MNNVMSVKQTLKCGLHSPEKWQNDYNDSTPDDRHNLPYAAPVNMYEVDEYAACPDNWMHGSNMVSSYFAGLQEDWAMWLDFNYCFGHTHDVAVVLSVQGINPVTGQTMIGDNPLRLEQYHNNCPIHNSAFKQDYFCEECGFKWPGQNYMATTGTPFGMLWLDGFRAPDGNVRQYIITAEKMRGVAAQVMDHPEDRVFAIGMAFYLSRAKKPEMPKIEEKPTQNGGPVKYSKPQYSNPMFFSPLHTSGQWNAQDMGSAMHSYSGSASSSVNNSTSTNSFLRGANKGNQVDTQDIDIDDSLGVPISAGPVDGIITHHAFNVLDMTEAVETVIPVKKLEVGAGALVSQRVYDDPKNLKEYWEEKPAGMIYLNYCDEETLKKILDAGKRASTKDGFMKGIQVGG